MSEPSLIEVRRQPEQRRLRLSWSDRYSGEIDYDTLRGYCPCAGCQGHSAAKITFHAPKRPVQPESIEAVGHYAISILWSDGHGTGIYRYEFLRDLCESVAAKSSV